MKNTEQKEPIPFEVYWRRKRIKKIMQWMIPIALIIAWVVLSPMYYSHYEIKAVRQKESSFLREIDIPDEMRLPTELIRQAADEYGAAGVSVKIEDTPSGKLLQQAYLDAFHQIYSVKKSDKALFYMSIGDKGDIIFEHSYRRGKDTWHYSGDGTVFRVLSYEIFGRMDQRRMKMLTHGGSVWVSNKDNQNLWAYIAVENMGRLYEFSYVDYRTFMDAYDSGTLPEGTKLTFEELETFRK